MRFINQLAQDARLIIVLSISNVFLFICCSVSLLSLYAMPKHIKIYIPPDISNGALIAHDSIPKPYVYEFALNIWQLLNDWSVDGSVNYLENLNQYRLYLHPSFYQELHSQYVLLHNKGELTHRVRKLHFLPGPIPASESVTVIDSNTWQVKLALQLTEFVNGVQVKDKTLVFELLVVRSDANRQSNPFGLILAALEKPSYAVERPSHG